MLQVKIGQVFETLVIDGYKVFDIIIFLYNGDKILQIRVDILNDDLDVLGVILWVLGVILQYFIENWLYAIEFYVNANLISHYS